MRHRIIITVTSRRAVKRYTIDSLFRAGKMFFLSRLVRTLSFPFFSPLEKKIVKSKEITAKKKMLISG